MQPSLFPTLRYDHSVDPFFRSDDDALHQLRVETYGGASWLTEFSLLAGVSTHSFGGMRQFVQTFTQNKLKDTLPQALERCGYRNVVFYPMLRNFVSNDRFYTSIGLKEIFDMKAQGAKTGAGARPLLLRQRAGRDGAALQVVAQAALHLHPDHVGALALRLQVSSRRSTCPAAGPAPTRRCTNICAACRWPRCDYDYLMGELRRRFPHERFLIVHYGDHHPMATRTLLGFGNDTEAEDVALDPDSIGFITYYATHGINYRVPALPQFEPLDVRLSRHRHSRPGRAAACPIRTASASG